MVALIAAVLIPTGCSTALGFMGTPKTVKGTHIELIDSERGIEYKTLIGGTETAQIFAVLDENGSYRIDFIYTDTRRLNIEAVFLETENLIERIDVPNPLIENPTDGETVETGSAYIRKSVLETMIETAVPTIYLKGRNGTVILEMGVNGKSRLKELIEFGNDRFPGD